MTSWLCCALRSCSTNAPSSCVVGSGRSWQRPEERTANLSIAGAVMNVCQLVGPALNLAIVNLPRFTFSARAGFARLPGGGGGGGGSGSGSEAGWGAGAARAGTGGLVAAAGGAPPPWQAGVVRFDNLSWCGFSVTLLAVVYTVAVRRRQRSAHPSAALQPVLGAAESLRQAGAWAWGCNMR
eukprot:SAG11_NODE_3678_length_2292_cov_3.587779_2_plen_182_part_00